MPTYAAHPYRRRFQMISHFQCQRGTPRFGPRAAATYFYALSKSNLYQLQLH